MAVSTNELQKALESLEKALKAPKNDLARDATILRFEFCVELSWKCAKKHMGTASTAPKQIVREMAQNDMITDVEIWIESINQKNLSSHTYNEELAEKVYEFAKSFAPYIKQLLNKMK